MLTNASKLQMGCDLLIPPTNADLFLLHLAAGKKPLASSTIDAQGVLLPAGPPAMLACFLLLPLILHSPVLTTLSDACRDLWMLTHSRLPMLSRMAALPPPPARRVRSPAQPSPAQSLHHWDTYDQSHALCVAGLLLLAGLPPLLVEVDSLDSRSVTSGRQLSAEEGHHFPCT